MTYSDITATGRGSLSFRLVIEGFHLEAVTKSTMEKAASGSNRARKQGLSVRGVKISQRADLPRATVESESASFSFIDYDEVWTAAFAADPLYTTWLAADATGGFSSLTVDSTADWPSEGFLWLNSEVIRYESKTSTSFGTLTRGQYNTIQQDHFTWGGARRTYPEITSSHTILQGRRVRLYAYGQGDDPQGDGQQIWLGIVSGEPRMQGTSWSLSADPITALLEQDIGADLGPNAVARGIHIPAPYSASFIIERRAVTPAAGLFPIPNQPDGWVAATTSHTISVNGFFETQADFIAAINAEIATVTSTWSSVITAHEGAPGFLFDRPEEYRAYHFKADIPSTSVYGETVNVRSAQGCSPTEPNFGLATEAGSNPQPLTSGGVTIYWRPSLSDFPGRDTPPISGAGTVPRGLFSGNSTLTNGNRLYVASEVAVTSNATAAVITVSGEEYLPSRVSNIDATNGYIELEIDAEGAYRGFSFSTYTGRTFGGTYFAFSSESVPSITFGRFLARALTTSTPGAGTYALLLALQTDVPSQVNLGALPMFQPGDWNASEWNAAYVDRTNYAKWREYMVVEPTQFGEIVSPDLQLAGLFLALDSSGRMTVKKLRLAVPTEIPVASITSANLITDDGFPQYDIGAIGAYNQIDIQDGYNAISDEYEGVPVRVRDVAAFGRNPVQRSLQIKPKSRYYDVNTPYEDAVRIAQGVLGIYGGPYAYVTCEVPLTFMSVALGSTVSVSTKQLPNRLGLRGVSAALGVVTAREIDLYAARISLTILLSASRISGYAWGGRIKSGSENNISGDKWELELETGLYYASGAEAEDYLDKLDAIVIYRWDSTSSTTITGTVDGASGNIVTVDLDSTWTPGSDEWAIAFDDSGGANTLTTSQKRFAYIASSDSRVFASEPARVFSAG